MRPYIQSTSADCRVQQVERVKNVRSAAASHATRGCHQTMRRRSTPQLQRCAARQTAAQNLQPLNRHE